MSTVYRSRPKHVRQLRHAPCVIPCKRNVAASAFQSGTVLTDRSRPQTVSPVLTILPTEFIAIVVGFVFLGAGLQSSTSAFQGGGGPYGSGFRGRRFGMFVLDSLIPPY